MNMTVIMVERVGLQGVRSGVSAVQNGNYVFFDVYILDSDL